MQNERRRGPYTRTWSSTTPPWRSSTSKGKSTSSSKGTSSKVPNFEGLGKKGGKLRRIWELSEIEARELQRSKERETEACELMQQIFEMEKEYEEQQASRGSSSSSNDKENENASDSTECIYDEVAESS